MDSAEHLSNRAGLLGAKRKLLYHPSREFTLQAQ
jgi:hypothetical protein